MSSLSLKRSSINLGGGSSGVAGPSRRALSSSPPSQPSHILAPTTSSGGPGPSMSSTDGSYTHNHGGADSLALSLCQQLFVSTIPIAVSVSLTDLPPGSDAALAKELVYYTSARRSSYLPLLLHSVRENLVDLVVPFGDSGAVKEEDLWFEYRGVPLKWHWPIGLLYDHTLNNLAPSQHPHPDSLNLASRPSTSAPIPWHITLRLRNVPHAKLPPPSSNPTTAVAASGAISRLTESAKQAYMAMLKEADYVRNGNTKKVNNLRKEEQDGIWEAVRSGNWSSYSALVSKLLPPLSAWPVEAEVDTTSIAASTVDAASSSAIPNRSSSLHTPVVNNESQTSLVAPSLESPFEGLSDDNAGTAGAGSTVSGAADGGTGQLPSSAGVVNALKGQPLPGLKAIPVKFVLQGSVVLQEAVPPMKAHASANAAPTAVTLANVLHAVFPALFPLAPGLADTNGDPAAATNPGVEAAQLAPLAVPIIHGIRVPLESSMPWLSRVMSGAEGWLTVVLLLLPKGDAA